MTRTNHFCLALFFSVAAGAAIVDRIAIAAGDKTHISTRCALDRTSDYLGCTGIQNQEKADLLSASRRRAGWIWIRPKTESSHRNGPRPLSRIRP